MPDDLSSHVGVDSGELRDVAAWLHDEARLLAGDREHLRPEVHFGHHSPCGDTHLARCAAISTLGEHHARWDEHRQELASLATALEKALGHYADADTDHFGKLEQ